MLTRFQFNAPLRTSADRFIGVDMSLIHMISIHVLPFGLKKNIGCCNICTVIWLLRYVTGIGNVSFVICKQVRNQRGSTCRRILEAPTYPQFKVCSVKIAADASRHRRPLIQDGRRRPQRGAERHAQHPSCTCRRYTRSTHK